MLQVAEVNMLVRQFIGGFLIFVAGVAAAQQARLDVVSSYENLGVSVVFPRSAMPGSDLSLAVRRAETEDPFQTAHPLSEIADREFLGSVVGLEPDTLYELRLQSSALSGDQFKLARTRSEVLSVPRGRTYFVSQDQGLDTNSGLRPATAFKTIGRALSAARAGTRIVIEEGVYFEGDFMIGQSGTADAPIVIEGAPDAEVILDGRDPLFDASWGTFDRQARIYRAPLAVQPNKIYLDGDHFFRHRSIADLQSLRWSMPGFHTDGSFIYARFPGDALPESHTVSIPRHSTALTFVRQSHWQIRGLTFQYYGHSPFHRGIYLDESDHILIEHCRFLNNVVGVGVKRGADFNTIQDCLFEDPALADWDWNAVKSGVAGYEGGGIYVYGSDQPNRGNVIRRNRFMNTFDGAHLYSDNLSGPTQNMDFYDNTIINCQDDGVETDGAGSNNRIYRNWIKGFLTGISVAPAAIGPTYIFRNVLSQWHSVAEFTGYPFKFNSGSSFDTRHVFLYHNTCYTDVPGQNGFLFKRYSRWSEIVSRNNIYAGTITALESQSGSNPVDFDYDNLWTTSTGRLVRWDGLNHSSIAQFTAASGQEPNGIAVSPEFTDGVPQDYTLKSSSPLVDRGVLIPGFNDLFSGDAPDIGALEYQTPTPVRLPAFVQSVSLEGENVRLHFVGGAMQQYLIRSTASLVEPIVWTRSHGVFEAGDEGEFDMVDFISGEARFYRAFEFD